MPDGAPFYLMSWDPPSSARERAAAENVSAVRRIPRGGPAVLADSQGIAIALLALRLPSSRRVRLDLAPGVTIEGATRQERCHEQNEIREGCDEP
jgi:hypothetical protein